MYLGQVWRSVIGFPYTTSLARSIDKIINKKNNYYRRFYNYILPFLFLDLTITGKACPRLLSGSQRARQQEADILQTLRDEGFISTSKQKTGGGLAFEVVESSPLAESAGGKIKPKVIINSLWKQNQW